MTRVLPEQLWQMLRRNFESDDGSLPTIELQNLAGAEVAELYSVVRSGAQIGSQDATFWDLSQATERRLDDVPNAALLVSSGKAAPFHFVIEKASACDTI